MGGTFTLGQFLREFKTEKDCFMALAAFQYPNGITCPKCQKVTKHYKVTNKKSLVCKVCRHQTFPLTGSIFEKSSTPLKFWLYAILLMSSTRSGISAKQLQRELGVTYKTAWRMFHLIRKAMAEDHYFFGDTVEMDETYLGGAGKNRRRESRLSKEKQVVFGIVKHHGRKVWAKHVKNAGKWTIKKEITNHVHPNTPVFSDQSPVYTQLNHLNYYHDFVTHQRQFVKEGEFDTVHTQRIEGFWSHLKRGIFGVYKNVSAKHLQKYVDEFCFRYNYGQGDVFSVLLERSLKSSSKGL